MSTVETVEQGYAWFESFLAIDRAGYEPRRHRLARMRSLLAAFGDPHRACPTIHIVGSKGKGSTAAFIGFVLHAAGRRCGVYASPHVESYRERVRVLDGSLSDAIALELFGEIERYVARQRDIVPEAELPTTFELLTLFAFLAFRAAGCDIAVVEAGLGGRTDATNLVDPIASVVTPVELEHTEQLGTTYRSIAAEKGGVIKEGRPVYVSDQTPEAMATLRRIAELRGAPFRPIEDQLTELSSATGAEGTRVTIRLRSGLVTRATLRLLGTVQAENAALALLVVSQLFPDIPHPAMEAGLSDAWIPGRAELVSTTPPVLLDGAHTDRSVERLCATVNDLCPSRTRRVVVFGAVTGKNHRAMLRVLTEHFPHIIIARPGTFKRSDVDELVRVCVELGGRCTQSRHAEDAIALARATAGPGDGALIVVTGSFYLVGEIRAELRKET